MEANNSNNMFPTTTNPFGDDKSTGSRSNHDHSMISATSTAAANNNDMMMMMSNGGGGGSGAAFNPTNNNAPSNNNDDDNNNGTEETQQLETAITQERQHLTKENTARLQSILENIKDATKNILTEMNVFLKETEEVEKVYVRCRAKTRGEMRRLEMVEPEVMGMLTMNHGAPGGVGGGGMGMFAGAMMGMNEQSVAGAGAGGSLVTPRDSL